MARCVVGEVAVVVRQGVVQAGGAGGEGHCFECAVVHAVRYAFADWLGVGVAVPGFCDQDFIADVADCAQAAAVAGEDGAVGNAPLADVAVLADAGPDCVDGSVDGEGHGDGDVVGIGGLQIFRLGIAGRRWLLWLRLELCRLRRGSSCCGERR